MVVSALKAAGVAQAETFPKDHRPWGWLESLVIGARCIIPAKPSAPIGILDCGGGDCQGDG